MTRFQRYPAVLAALTGTDRLSSIRASLGAMLDDCFGANLAVDGRRPNDRFRSVSGNPSLRSLGFAERRKRHLANLWQAAQVDPIRLWAGRLETVKPLEIGSSGIAKTSLALNRYAVEEPEFYSMTSSARTRIVSGIVRPSSLAVLRLTTSSYFAGDCTGRLAAFSPLRIRST